MFCDLQENPFLWIEWISEKSLKTQGSDINNHHQNTHGMWPLEKYISYLPREYLKKVKSKTFRYQELPLVYTWHVTPSKTCFMWTKVMSDKHSKIKDWDIKKRY